jgi:hypothetical protein
MNTTTEPLTPAQLDGCACVICGESSRPMLPLGIETRSSSDLFACDRPECAADVAHVRGRIPVAQRVKGRRVKMTAGKHQLRNPKGWQVIDEAAIRHFGEFAYLNFHAKEGK